MCVCCAQMATLNMQAAKLCDAFGCPTITSSSSPSSSPFPLHDPRLCTIPSPVYCLEQCSVGLDIELPLWAHLGLLADGRRSQFDHSSINQ